MKTKLIHFKQKKNFKDKASIDFFKPVCDWAMIMYDVRYEDL